MKIPFEEYKNIYSKVTRLTIELLIVNSNNEFILTLRNIDPFKGQWHLPGGTVLLEESITDSVNRIALEELGSKIDIIDNIGIIDFAYDGSTRSIGLVFKCLLKTKPSDIKLDYQANKWSFFSEPPNNTIKEHYDFIKKYYSASI